MFVVATGAALAAALLQGFAPFSSDTYGSARPVADSVRIVRAARSAQSSFEAFRRQRLPVADRFRGPCEIRIGRYCYWRGDEDDTTPPAEAAPIRERRDQLIRLLDSATAQLSGDSWLAGQHVRYLTEANRFDDALRFATTVCRAPASWCAALAGYSAHVAGRFALADSAYRGAFQQMDAADRCRWLDIEVLLTDELERRFKAAGCDGREAFVRRVFWLGSPLLSVSETDLFTEHLARLTRARIAEHSAAPDGEVWADDERELVLRYGWPRWYSRSLPEFGSQIRPSIAGHDAGMPYDFLPSATALDHLGHVTMADWRLDDPLARRGYAPAYARSVHDVAHQIAAFRRGDSTLVIGAWDARRDTTLLGRTIDAALVLASDDGRRALGRRSDVGTRGMISVIGVVDSGLISLELLAAQDRRAARARIGLPGRSAGRVALSDLLLYAPAAATVDALDEVADSSLTSTVIPTNRAVGVYWEVYGLHREGEPVQYSLSVEQIGVGWMRRAAERLRLADPTSGLRIQWDEVPRQVGKQAGRGVRLDLSRLRSGRYRVQLTATVRGETPVVAEREIDVR